MKRFSAWVLAAGVLLGFTGTASADADKDAKAILDKAIKAMGGEEKLKAVKAFTWKTKGTVTFGGNDNAFSGQTTAEGLDHYRAEFEGNFGGNEVKGVTVINGDKGWRKFGEMAMDIDVAVEKRNIYLQLVPQTLLPLKDKSFKIEAAGETKIGDKPAVGLKITGPDGKDFTIYFDKETGLPVRQVAKVTGFMGDEFTQETTYSSYKDFGGIKKPTKIESKRDGEKFVDVEMTEFKVLDKVDPKTFAEPE